MKPVLLLDIDGVIAPFGGGHADLVVQYKEPEDEAKLTHLEHNVGMYALYIRRDLPQIMRELRPHFTLMWGTAWGVDEANRHMNPILEFEDPLEGVEYRGSIPGIVEMKMSGWSWEPGKMPDTWKLPWIQQFAAEDGRPLVFIDDEIVQDGLDWAETRTAEGIPTLLIPTNHTIGWTDDHLPQLIEWAEEVKNG